MGENITLRLDKIYATKIHGPRIDGFPIYSRTDGAMESGSNGIATAKSDRWVLGTEKKFSSPNNIRKVFITHDKVVIQMYAPIAGASGQGLWRTAAVRHEEDPIESAKYMEEFTGHVMSKAIGDSASIKRITIKGNALSALVKPWVCSNLEELYFDASVFMSEDIRNMSPSYKYIFNGELKGIGADIHPDIPRGLFEQACGSDIKSIRGRFPRLKVVAFISSLSNILDTDHYKGDTHSIGVDSIGTSWIANTKNMEYVKASCGSFGVSNIGTDLHKYNDSFALRSGVYRFDDLILQTVFEELKRKNREKHIAQQKGLVGADGRIETAVEVPTNTNETKSKLEQVLDNVRANSTGDGEVSKVLALTMSGQSLKNIREALADMSDDGEKLYSKLFKKMFNI